MFNNSKVPSSQYKTTYATIRWTHDTQYHKYKTRHHGQPTTYYTQYKTHKIQNLLSVSSRGRKKSCYWFYNVFVHASWKLIFELLESPRTMKFSNVQACEFAVFYYVGLKTPLFWNGHKDKCYWFHNGFNNVLWKLSLEFRRVFEALPTTSNVMNSKVSILHCFTMSVCKLPVCRRSHTKVKLWAFH